MRSSLRKLGRLDLLVHSNGIHRVGPLSDASLRDFDQLWAANVRGPLILTQLFVPALRETRGQIAFVNSTVGLDTRAGVGQFASTQHALRALADTLRLELNDDGIRVLSVYPGRTATERQRRIFSRRGESLRSRDAAAARGRRDDPRRVARPAADCGGDGRSGTAGHQTAANDATCLP